jgi:hypothetical protein
LLTWAGAGWLVKWVPAYAPRPRRASEGREAQEG